MNHAGNSQTDFSNSSLGKVKAGSLHCTGCGGVTAAACYSYSHGAQLRLKPHSNPFRGLKALKALKAKGDRNNVVLID